jgi:outer membrane receptor for ferrienterochelin and colicin
MPAQRQYVQTLKQWQSMKHRIVLHANIVASIIVATVAGAHVQASDATINPADSLEEITVTTERRETNLQRTPAAISTVGGDALSERRIQDIIDLSNSLPNVNIGERTGQGNIAIRGIGFATLNPGDAVGWHGVTTAVMGNCGAGFVPVSAAGRDQLVSIMEGVEGITADELQGSQVW